MHAYIHDPHRFHKGKQGVQACGLEFKVFQRSLRLQEGFRRADMLSVPFKKMLIWGSLAVSTSIYIYIYIYIYIFFSCMLMLRAFPLCEP